MFWAIICTSSGALDCFAVCTVKMDIYQGRTVKQTSNITRMITSKGIRWVDLEAREGKGDTYRVLVAKHEGKRSLRIYVSI